MTAPGGESARPVGADDATDITGLERTNAIEWVLNNANGAMRPIEIWAELTRLGRNDPKMEVQVTTFDPWERKRIGKLGRGQYIALKAS